MLNIYLNKKISVHSHSDIDVHFFNDAFFDLYLNKIKINDDIISIIKQIDGIDYADHYRIWSKFQEDTTVRMDELSTGCKTAINVYAFPDKIFFAGGCGENALQVICGFKDGNILLNETFFPLKFENQIQVINGENKKIVHNDSELEDELVDFCAEG